MLFVSQAPRLISNDKLKSRQSITWTIHQQQRKHKGRTRSNAKRTLKRGSKLYPPYTMYVGEIYSEALNTEWVMVFYEAAGKDEGGHFLFHAIQYTLITSAYTWSYACWSEIFSHLLLQWLIDWSLFIVMGFNTIFQTSPISSDGEKNIYIKIIKRSGRRSCLSKS